MTLILEVTSPQPMKGGGTSRQTFHEDGGTIGRESDNTWVLSHSKVSGHHAVITCRSAVYYIEDTSRNGVCLNSSKNRLERGRPYALKSGDRILIDPYEIQVSVTGDRSEIAEPRDASDPFGADDPFAPRPIPSSGLDTPAEEIAGQALDPLELLNLVPKQAPERKAKARSAKDLEFGSPLDGHYRPPDVMPAPVSARPARPMTIPKDYDPLADSDPVADSDLVADSDPLAGYNPLAPDDAPSMPAPSSPPPREKRTAHRPPQAQATPLSIAPEIPALPIAPEIPPPRDIPEPVRDRTPSAASTDPQCAADFAAVLAGAGLDPANVNPEVADVFGQILRVVVSGVMDVMRSRQEIKDEFRMRMTRFKSAENNPLKFSANVEDALHNLLVKRNPAYLPPVEAFEDAFADLRNHQIAMLAGMRVAFESMLAEFDPDRLQQEFDLQLGKGLVPAKLRYWDLFREKRHEIVKDPEASFRRLFGDEFARAYEDQLTELKAQERSGKRASSRTPKQSDT